MGGSLEGKIPYNHTAALIYFMADPADPKNLIVEPWVDFYSSGVVDWSQKSDENAEQSITNGDPNQYKTIVFKYKDAGDYLSKLDKSNYPLGRTFFTLTDQITRQQPVHRRMLMAD